MFEAMAQLVLGDHFGGRTFDPPQGPAGYARVLAPHRKPFATKDGYLCVLMYNDKQWQNFFSLIGQEETYRNDARFNSHVKRSHHIAELNEFVAQQMTQRTTAEWLPALQAADIPVAAMNSLDELLEDEHFSRTGFIRRTMHPSEGPVSDTAVPTQWSRSAPSEPRPAPRLGEHSAEILREAGYTDEQLAALFASGVTAGPR